MKVYLFSINEATEELSKWSFQRLGHEVIVIKDINTSFKEKYEQFLEMAKDEWVLRSDADVIALRKLNDFVDLAKGSYQVVEGQNYFRRRSPKLEEPLWFQPLYFCFQRYEALGGGIQLMNKEIIEKTKKIGIKEESRPETALWREPEIQPHTETIPMVCAIHGMGQTEEHLKRTMEAKRARGVEFDEELIEKVKDLR